LQGYSQRLVTAAVSRVANALEHARFIRHDYAVDGIDINENYLGATRLKNPSGNFTHADLMNLGLVGVGIMVNYNPYSDKALVIWTAAQRFAGGVPTWHDVIIAHMVALRRRARCG